MNKALLALGIVITVSGLYSITSVAMVYSALQFSGYTTNNPLHSIPMIDNLLGLFSYLFAGIYCIIRACCKRGNK